MTDLLIDLVTAFKPTWRPIAMLVVAAIFIAGLLFERLWFLASLKRDVAAMKDELPKLRADIDAAKTKAEEALTKTGVYVNMLDNLQEAVLDIPNQVRDGVVQGVRMVRDLR